MFSRSRCSCLAVLLGLITLSLLTVPVTAAISALRLPFASGMKSTFLTQGKSTLCPLGHYCPAGATAPVRCNVDLGEYCPSVGLWAPLVCYIGQDLCAAPDVFNRVPCPDGSSCITGIPIPCYADTYSFQGTCKNCPNQMYTSDAGSADCSKPSQNMIAVVTIIPASILLTIIIFFWKICRSPRRPDAHAAAAREQVLRRWKAEREPAQRLAATKPPPSVALSQLRLPRVASPSLPALLLPPLTQKQLLERLMRDLHSDLLVRYPRGWQVVASDEGVPADMYKANSAPVIMSSVGVQWQLHVYEQFVFKTISVEFEKSSLASILNSSSFRSQPVDRCNDSMNECFKTMMGIQPMVLASFPTFAEIDVNPYDEEEVEGVETCTVDRQSIAALVELRQRLGKEMQRYISVWTRRYEIPASTHVSSPAPMYCISRPAPQSQSQPYAGAAARLVLSPGGPIAPLIAEQLQDGPRQEVSDSLPINVHFHVDDDGC